MGPSKVWYMDARARRFLESTAIKGRQIIERSGWLDRLKRGNIVAVKTHMGEAYNVGYLRPVIISTLVDLLKERGLLRPFVTDTTTADYEIEEVPLDRSQAAINTYYPEVRAKKLKTMYAKHHPLKGLDTASFGRPTEGVMDPRHPKK